MPDTGLFFLFEVCGSPPSATATAAAYTTIDLVRAQCISCLGTFKASEPPDLQNLPGGGAVIVCPECGARQAIAGARFAEFVERFPAGNCTTYKPGQTRSLHKPEVGCPLAAASEETQPPS